MEDWQEDCVEGLLDIESEQELFLQVAKIASKIGFEYCAYGIQIPVPVSQPRIAMFSNYSHKWQQCYSENGYIRIDPTVRHALKSTLPIVWSSSLFESAKDFWEEAKGHGLRHGWAQAAHDGNGAVGLLTLARGTENLSASELRANQARMAWLTQYTHAAMARLLIPQLAPESQIAMTAREQEVLRWTAEGKTAFEIGQILGVSERTINFHINNVVAKLGTRNKTQAAVKAAALGMLS